MKKTAVLAVALKSVGAGGSWSSYDGEGLLDVFCPSLFIRILAPIVLTLYVRVTASCGARKVLGTFTGNS